MPAHSIQRTDPNHTYFHLYNKGVENRTIFNENADYDVFLGFLKDYLSAPDHESAKKEFMVNGRTFRGLPHQPKNYLGKVKLVAYSLKPNEYHIVLHQFVAASIEGFIRSLCTRYSIYFNKKYKRSGSLFEGPYKSVLVKNSPSLSSLLQDLHASASHDYSSNDEYAGRRKTSWIHPVTIIPVTKKNEANKQESKVLERTNQAPTADIKIQPHNEHLARSIPAQDLASTSLQKIHTHLSVSQRMPEVFTATFIFCLLIGFGIRNINASAVYTTVSVATPAVAGTSSTAIDSPESPETKPIQKLVVMIKDNAASVNIRKEPTTTSEKISKAIEGDTFITFAVVDANWFEVTLTDGSTGYISTQYAHIVEEPTQ
jgi:putative transposase